MEHNALFKAYYEDFEVFDELSYYKSFDYGKTKLSFADLNFVYLCSKRTFRCYKQYMGLFDKDFIEEMDAVNRDLFTNDDILKTSVDIIKSDLQDFRSLEYILKDNINHQDLVFMGEACFKLIKKTFTSLKEVKRVLYKTDSGLDVELYPPRVRVLLLDNSLINSMRLEYLDKYINKYTVTVVLSKYMNDSDLRSYLAAISIKKCDWCSKHNQIIIPNTNYIGSKQIQGILGGQLDVTFVNNSSLYQHDIRDNKLIIFYFKGIFDTWKINFKATEDANINIDAIDDSSKKTYSYGWENDREELLHTENDGIVGLSNLGNTCYMNSAFQCMLRTAPLKSFILSDLSCDINHENPLGSKGKILLEFADFAKQYWKTPKSSISTFTIKNTIGRHLTMFDDYAQHDAQEFLSQILDIMHEDTNKILRKPYTKQIEGKSGDDDLAIARASWINFLKRNYSFFIENFYGQFKSTISCPECQSMNVRFEPYQIISLSLPMISTGFFIIYFINSDNTKKMQKFRFTAKSTKFINDIPLSSLIDIYSGKLGIPSDRLIFASLKCSGIGEIYNKKTPLSVFTDMHDESNESKANFIIELNDTDVKSLKNSNPVEIFLQISYDIYDEEYQYDNTFQAYTMQKHYEKHPVYTRVFYLTQNNTVRDIYVAALRKIYNCTNIYNFRENDQLYFEQLWDLLETRMKHKIFFYLKIGYLRLSSTFMNKRISEIIGGNNKRLLVNMFIITTENISINLNFNLLKDVANNFNMDFIYESCDIKQMASQYSLQYLLELFAQSEILNNENMWHCVNCSKHVQARKVLQIYKAPRILIIQLKKVRPITNNLPLITFPLDYLDMSPYVINQEPIQSYNILPEEFLCESDLLYYRAAKTNVIIDDHKPTDSLKYQLYGVINHYGTQESGHYTAFCKLEEDKWFEFNDSFASSINKDKIVSNDAYILFYKKIEPN